MPGPTTAGIAASLDAGLPVVLSPGDLQLLIGELIGLLQTCFPDPTPEAAAAWLKEPSEGLFGLRHWLWERQIKNAVAKAWRGDRAVVGIVQSAVLMRIKQGVTPVLMAKLYAEHQ